MFVETMRNLLAGRAQSSAPTAPVPDGQPVDWYVDPYGYAHVKAADGGLAAAIGVAVGALGIAGFVGSLPVAPVVTAYTPVSTAYLKVTPNAADLDMFVRPRVVTQALVYAPAITHKIADTGTDVIAANDATNLATSKVLSAELIIDVPAHIASTTYHAAAGAVVIPGHKVTDAVDVSAAAVMSTLGTGYVLADDLATQVTAHAVSTTYHKAASAYSFDGTPTTEPTLRAKANALRTAMLAHFADTAVHGVADAINLALVTATTAGSDQASDQTLINLLQTYWNSHVAVGAATPADLAAVVVYANAVRAAQLLHFADATVAHGGTADATDLATLTAVPAASDQTTVNTLLTAEKAVDNLHLAILDDGAYMTIGAALMPLHWPCKGAFWCKTDTSAGTFATSEFRSA
jgi:hypothetical protein